MVKKSNNWNLQEMQETLVKDTEQRISDGFQEIANEQQVGEHQTIPADAPTRSLSDISHQTSPVSPQPSEQEPTKGVQTYIPMSDYLRLNTIKCHRGETIAALVAQAIELWLDVQEGKRKVEKL